MARRAGSARSYVANVNCLFVDRGLLAPDLLAPRTDSLGLDSEAIFDPSGSLDGPDTC